MKAHDPHCPVPRGVARGEGVGCLCRPTMEEKLEKLQDAVRLLQNQLKGVTYDLQQDDYHYAWGGVIPDWLLRHRALLPASDPRRLLIDPWAEGVSKPGQISYGLTSFGYDVRAGRNYLIFSDIAATEVDPLTLATTIESRKKEGRFAEFKDVDTILIPPNSFALAESLETVCIPRDVICLMLGKSTYARCGCNLNMTPLEPHWQGKITIEIANMTRLPLRIHSEQGIGQMIFLQGVAPCQRSYDDKKGRYQNQTGLTLPTA